MSLFERAHQRADGGGPLVDALVDRGRGGEESVQLSCVGVERRLSPRRATATKVDVVDVNGTETHWAGLICDASSTGILLCSELHPSMTVGAAIRLVDAHGRWVVGTIVREASHGHFRLRYYGVALNEVSHDLELQFPSAGLQCREQLLQKLVDRLHPWAGSREVA